MDLKFRGPKSLYCVATQRYYEEAIYRKSDNLGLEQGDIFYHSVFLLLQTNLILRVIQSYKEVRNTVLLNKKYISLQFVCIISTTLIIVAYAWVRMVADTKPSDSTISL